MKKVFVWFIVALMCVSLFAGCGDTDTVQPAVPSVNEDQVNTPKPEEPAQPEESAQPEELAELSEGVKDWWSTSWYGWWCIKNGNGAYEGASDIAWDAYAEIEINNNSADRVRIWDTGTSKEELLIIAYDISLEPGASEIGKLRSGRVDIFPYGKWNNGMEAVTMSEREIGWDVDPAASSVSHFPGMLEIKGHYESPDNSADSFDYFIYLRPWGAGWEDVRNGDTEGCIYNDMMPLYYDNWYVTLVNMGYAEPPVSFETGIEAIEREMAPAVSLDAADKEGADGIVSLQTLKDVLEWCKSDTTYDTTYDEVAAKIGAHGKAIESLFEGVNIYRWLADEDNYIQISFTVKDGVEYWNVTQWSGLK